MSLLGDIKKIETHLTNQQKSAEGQQTSLPRDIRTLTGYDPREVQKELHLDLNRFNVLVCHRRMGKTVMCIQELIEAAIECPFRNGRYAYIAPTYAMAEDIAWAYLVEFTAKIPGILLEKSKLAVWLPTRNGGRARIRLYGVDSPKQRLRGLYLDGFIMDEMQDVPLSVWTEQVRPMVSDKNRSGMDDTGRINQWGVFIGTPKGRNQFHKIYRDADLWSRGKPVAQTNKETGKQHFVYRDNWYAAIHRASETGLISASELQDARADMGDSKYDQEYECSFDAAIEGAIFGRDIHNLRKRGHLTSIPYFAQRPVVTGWDLGYDDSTAIWFAQLFGNEIRFIDFYEARNENLMHYAEVLADKGYRYSRHYFPHDVEVTELGTGKSRRSILTSLGIRVSTVPKHPLWDGIAAAQAAFPRMWYDETLCADGLDKLALYQRVYDEKLGRYIEKPLHNFASHAADGLRTLVMGIRLAIEEGEDIGDGAYENYSGYGGIGHNSGMTHGQFDS